MTDLIVELYGLRVGVLAGPWRTFDFLPDPAAVAEVRQPNDGEIGLAVDGEYRHAALTMDHLVAEGSTWGLTGGADVAEETLATVLGLAQTETPHERAHAGLASDIAGFSANLLAGRAAGASGQYR